MAKKKASTFEVFIIAMALVGIYLAIPLMLSSGISKIFWILLGGILVLYIVYKAKSN